MRSIHAKTFSRPRHDVLAIGPGWGAAGASQCWKLIEKSPQPMVVDADALDNLLAPHIELLASCAGPRLLTPHPGEMARLLGNGDMASEGERPLPPGDRGGFYGAMAGRAAARGLAHDHRRTRASSQSYNTTGNPGMATGGMGDILTGVCAALTGQGLELYDAARLGAWLCGRAAEVAIESGGQSEESLSAGLLPAHLFGHTFKDLREGCW